MKLKNNPRLVLSIIATILALFVIVFLAIKVFKTPQSFEVGASKFIQKKAIDVDVDWTDKNKEIAAVLGVFNQMDNKSFACLGDDLLSCMTDYVEERLGTDIDVNEIKKTVDGEGNEIKVQRNKKFKFNKRKVE